MTDLLVVVPTRGRRANALRLAESIAATRVLDTKLILRADDDDHNYHGLVLPSGCAVVHGPRKTVTEATNEQAVYATRLGMYPYVMITGDDNVMVTPGWDKALIEPLRDRPGWSYPGGQRRYDIPESPVISAEIIRALGWAQCPWMHQYYVDMVWADLGWATGRMHFIESVRQEHRHFTNGGSEFDQTYDESGAHFESDEKAYFDWRRYRFRADLDTLRRRLGE